MYSLVAASQPVLRAALGPPFADCAITRSGTDEVEAKFAAISRVLSVLASSTTMISFGARVCAVTLCSARVIVLSEFYAGIMTETLVMSAVQTNSSVQEFCFQPCALYHQTTYRCVAVKVGYSKIR